MPYTVLEGNTGIHAQGATLQEALIAGAHGLFDVMSHGANIRPQTRVEFAVQARSSDELFELWLTHLLEQKDIHAVYFGDFDVASLQELDDGGYLMMGAAYGQAYDGEKTEVRGIKKGSAHCEQHDGLYSCDISLDL